MATRTHFRTCNLCEAMCGLRLEIDGDRIVDLRGDDDDPHSRGYVCPKATALQDLYEDPDRLRQPMRKVGDGWQPISWDEAFDMAVERLDAIQQAHGRDSVGLYFGNPNAHNFGTLTYGPAFFKTLGTKNRFSASSCDQWPSMFASYFMFGHQLLFTVPDVDHTDHMIMIGANPLASNGSLMAAPGIKKRLKSLVDRGKLVVVDPRRSETAELASEHVFIRPGTDALFLLSMLNELCKDGVKLGRLAPFTKNVDATIDLAKRYPASSTEDVTGIPAATVAKMAKELLAAPKAVVYGRIGACTQEFGGLTMWLINVINIVSGNFDTEGGSLFAAPAVDALEETGSFGIGRGSYGRWKSRVRGFPEFGGELPSSVLAEEILTEGPGQIKAMVTLAGNPILSTPNGAQLDRAFEQLDFVLAIDFFINETTRHADLILPPVSPVQRSHYDLALYLVSVRNTAKYSEPAFPMGKGEWDDWQILSELQCRLLAKREGKLSKTHLVTRAMQKLGPERVLDLGLRIGPYGKRFSPFNKGLSLRKLKDNPNGIDLGPLRPCLPDRMPSAHGGYVDLAPNIIVDDLERLNKRFAQWKGDSGELLLVGRRHLRSNNSWMHNSKRLMRGKNRCTLMMHPKDAENLGVETGGAVTIRSRVGEVTAPVEVTDEMMVGVISLPHGFGHGRNGVQLRVATENAGVSVNDLTDDQALDMLTGNAVLCGVPVKVEAAAKRAADAAE